MLRREAGTNWGCSCRVYRGLDNNGEPLKPYLHLAMMGMIRIARDLGRWKTGAGGELAGSLHLRIMGIRSGKWAGDAWNQLLILFTFLQPVKAACAAMVTKSLGKTPLAGLIRARLKHVSVVSSARKTQRQTAAREKRPGVSRVLCKSS